MLQNYSAGLLILALPFLASCASPAIEFEGRYWYPDLELEAKIVDDDIGETVDFVDELGLDDEDFPGGRIRWFTGPNSWIRLDYVPVDYDGDRTITEQIEFGGKVFTASTRVISSFDMQYLRLGWAWQFLHFWDGTFKLGTLVEAKGFDLDLDLDSPDTGITESESLPLVLPTVGVVVDLNPIEEINVYGEVSGISAGSYGYLYDAEAGVRFIPFHNFTVTAGYRILRLDVEVDEDDAKLEISGPFVGGSLRF